MLSSLVLITSVALPQAWVAYDARLNSPSKQDKVIARAVEQAGYQVRLLSTGVISSIPTTTRLVVLTNSRDLPARLSGAIDDYLENHGRLLALRTPAWQNPLYSLSGKWVSAEQFGRFSANRKPDAPCIELSASFIGQWTRSSNELKNPTWHKAEPTELANHPLAIHGRMSNLTSWDTLCSPSLDNPFGKDRTVTQFAAKGGPRTSQLAVEWIEKDGSRWIGTVPLSPSWRLYRLSPESFRFWPSAPGRGGSGDRFKPVNADRLSVGLAFSHTGTVGGPHEFWVANIGTSTVKPGEPADMMAMSLAPTDGLYPHYKFFKTTVPTKACPVGVAASHAVSIKDTYSLQPRPEPNGFDKRRQWTFEPLLVAKDKGGAWRGIPAALIRWNAGPRKGAGIASFAVTDDAFYQDKNALIGITSAAKELNRDVWFVDSGASVFTQNVGGLARFGATVYCDKPGMSGEVQIDRMVNGASGRLLDKFIDLKDGDCTKIETGDLLATPGTIASTLSVNGTIVEHREHQLYSYSPPLKKSFVTRQSGEFILDVKPTRFNGVNYMPSSGIGVEDNEYFEYWIDRQAYDPEIISRDLHHIKDLGMNAISAFIYGRSGEAKNLLDLIRQCRELGLKINLSLRPGTPMDFDWQAVSSIILRYRLKEEDTVFAYDLAWEPSMGDHNARKRYDSLWETWVKANYGDLSKAESEWKCAIPQEDGKVTNPFGKQLTVDGPWRLMVADYRRFVSDLLMIYYLDAWARVKKIDPNHLISFRMSEAGNPTFNWDGFMPYELSGISWATDFLAPEAYGRIGDWSQVRPGIFEVAYCRSMPSHPPVVWAEAGMSCLDSTRLVVDPALLKKQGDLYRDLYRMATLSESNGIFFWWYPGGVRVGENSDYGIINPDGTDRPNTLAIRKYGPTFLSAPKLHKKPANLYYLRNADARGVFGIYQRLQKEFWRCFKGGYDVKILDFQREGEMNPLYDPDYVNPMRQKLGYPTLPSGLIGVQAGTP